MFLSCLDSAIGNSETVSNARKNIIAEAKGLIAGNAKAEKAAQTSTRPAQEASRNLEESAASAGNSNLREEEELELRSGPLEASRTSNSGTVLGSPARRTAAAKDKKKAAFMLGDVDANVRAFLDRMRHQASLYQV